MQDLRRICEIKNTAPAMTPNTHTDSLLTGCRETIVATLLSADLKTSCACSPAALHTDAPSDPSVAPDDGEMIDGKMVDTTLPI